MGLFDQARVGAPSFPSNEADAILLMLVAAIAIDGRADDLEIAALTTIQRQSKTFRAWTPGQMKASMDRCAQRWMSDEKEDLLRRCSQSISIELREPVFMHICGLVLADDELQEKEMQYVELTQGMLGIEDQRGQMIVDAMVLLKKL